MAARWFKPSKDGKSFRFVPHFTPLEDRSVPATLYVDPTLSALTDGNAAPFEIGTSRAHTGQYASTLAFFLANQATADTFSSLTLALEVSEANAGADTIQLATGTIPLDNSNTSLIPVTGGTENGQPVTQALTLNGAGAGATIITPTTATKFNDGTGPVADSATAIFRANGAAANLTVSNLRLDASANKSGVGFFLRGGATGNFNGVAVSGVVFDPLGASSGVAVLAKDSTVNFVNSSVSGFGRNGVLFINSKGKVQDSEITGRGAGVFAQNGIEVNGGSKVFITGNLITGNNGTVNPGDRSSGIIVVDDGAGANPSDAVVVGNTITGNTVGLNVGAVTLDASTLRAAYNELTGNTFAAFGGVASTKLELANNWFGSANGPFFSTTKTDPVRGTIDDASKVNVTPYLSYPTPQLSPTDLTSFAAATANYLALITTIDVNVNPVGPSLVVAPTGSVQFTLTFARPVALNTVAPAALQPTITPADLIVTSTTGGTPVTTVTGSGANYTVTVSGLTGNGTVTVSVASRKAIDPVEGFLSSVSNVGAITINVPNAAPTITAIAGQTLTPTGSTGALAFTIGDDTTPVGNLVVTATSSNGAVVPLGSITLGGSGANRTVTVSNLPGVVGSSTITVTVTDTGSPAAATSTSFTVAVANAPPTITGTLPDQTLATSGASATLAFVLADDSTPAANLTVTVTSSNGAVVPLSSVTLTGTGANRSVTVANLPGVAGSSTITLTVADANGGTATRTFAVTVPAGKPTITTPTGTGFPDQSVVLPNGSTGALPFTVGDPLTPAGNLAVTVTSSNPTAVPLSSITLGGSGANRTVTVANLPTAAGGSSAVTLSVTNANGVVTSTTFNVTSKKRTRLFAVGADSGSLPEVQVYGENGQVAFKFTAFESTFTGGVRVAAADFDGDLTDDIVVVAGVSGAARVRVLSGATGVELANFFAYDTSFRGGAFVAAGDIDGDGTPEIVTGAGAGGGPHVKAFKLSGAVVQNFFAYDAAFRGGVTVAVADTNGNGKAEIITGAGPGGGPHVKAFEPTATGLTTTQNYFAFDTKATNGIFVAGGTFGIAAALGFNSSPEVRLQSGSKFTAYESTVTGGVRLGTFDVTGDGVDEILTAAGPGGGSRFRALRPDGQPSLNAFAFDSVSRTGYFIG